MSATNQHKEEVSVKKDEHKETEHCEKGQTGVIVVEGSKTEDLSMVDRVPKDETNNAKIAVKEEPKALNNMKIENDKKGTQGKESKKQEETKININKNKEVIKIEEAKTIDAEKMNDTALLSTKDVDNKVKNEVKKDEVTKSKQEEKTEETKTSKIVVEKIHITDVKDGQRKVVGEATGIKEDKIREKQVGVTEKTSDTAQTSTIVRQEVVKTSTIVRQEAVETSTIVRQGAVETSTIVKQGAVEDIEKQLSKAATSVVQTVISAVDKETCNVTDIGNSEAKTINMTKDSFEEQKDIQDIEAKTEDDSTVSVIGNTEDTNGVGEDPKVIDENEADKNLVKITPTDNEDVMEYTIEPSDATTIVTVMVATMAIVIAVFYYYF